MGKETAFGSEKGYRDYGKIGKDLGLRNDVEGIRQILTTMYGPDPVAAQRSAAIVQHCSDANPTLFESLFDEMIKVLEAPSHSSGLRVVYRALEKLEIPDDYQGPIIDSAFNHLMDPKTPIAGKVFSMSVIANHLDRYPELKSEFGLILSDLYPLGSAGVKARIRSINNKMRLELELC